MESIKQYGKNFKEIDIGLHEPDVELQDKIVDDLISGFLKFCQFESNYATYKENHSKIIFRLYILLPEYSMFYMDRMPFGKGETVLDQEKRCAKILILLWYITLVQNYKKVFSNENFFARLFLPTIKIGNTTNSKNFGFSKKVFGEKMHYERDLSQYHWNIKLKDFLKSETRIKLLLKKYLFEETNFCGKMMPITKQELEIIKKYC